MPLLETLRRLPGLKNLTGELLDSLPWKVRQTCFAALLDALAKQGAACGAEAAKLRELIEKRQAAARAQAGGASGASGGSGGGEGGGRSPRSPPKSLSLGGGAVSSEAFRAAFAKVVSDALFAFGEEVSPGDVAAESPDTCRKVIAFLAAECEARRRDAGPSDGFSGGFRGGGGGGRGGGSADQAPRDSRGHGSGVKAGGNGGGGGQGGWSRLDLGGGGGRHHGVPAPFEVAATEAAAARRGASGARPSWNGSTNGNAGGGSGSSSSPRPTGSALHASPRLTKRPASSTNSSSSSLYSSASSASSSAAAAALGLSYYSTSAAGMTLGAALGGGDGGPAAGLGPGLRDGTAAIAAGGQTGRRPARSPVDRGGAAGGGLYDPMSNSDVLSDRGPQPGSGIWAAAGALRLFPSAVQEAADEAADAAAAAAVSAEPPGRRRWRALEASALAGQAAALRRALEQGWEAGEAQAKVTAATGLVLAKLEAALDEILAASGTSGGADSASGGGGGGGGGGGDPGASSPAWQASGDGGTVAQLRRLRDAAAQLRRDLRVAATAAQREAHARGRLFGDAGGGGVGGGSGAGWTPFTRPRLRRPSDLPSRAGFEGRDWRRCVSPIAQEAHLVLRPRASHAASWVFDQTTLPILRDTLYE